MPHLRMHPAVQYAVAVAAIAGGVLLLYLLDLRSPVPTFLLAVIVSAWVGGTRAGALASVLALVVFVFVYTTVGHRPEPPLGVRLMYFAILAAFIVWIIDSERRKSESLRQARDTLQRHIDTLPVMGWIMLPDGRLEFINRRWLEYSGMSLTRALREAADTMHSADKVRALENWDRARELGEAYEQEMRLRRADGEYRWFLVRTVPFRAPDGSVICWYGTSTDIDELRRAKHDLHRLSRRLIEIQEEERRHLSRELHDEFGQLLAAIGMHIEAARMTADPAARTNLDQAAALTQRAGERARNLVLELRPSMLEAAGIDDTLRWLARQHMEVTGMYAEVSGVVGEVPDDIASACFRIVQQALTNVSQHARARRVWIEVSANDASYEIAIRDDGAGFDVDKTLYTAPRNGHIGLLGMRERVQLLGGELRIESSPGKGSRIVARFPKTAAA